MARGKGNGQLQRVRTRGKTRRNLGGKLVCFSKNISTTSNTLISLQWENLKFSLSAIWRNTPVGCYLYSAPVQTTRTYPLSPATLRRLAPASPSLAQLLLTTHLLSAFTSQPFIDSTKKWNHTSCLSMPGSFHSAKCPLFLSMRS